MVETIAGATASSGIFSTSLPHDTRYRDVLILSIERVSSFIASARTNRVAVVGCCDDAVRALSNVAVNLAA